MATAGVKRGSRAVVVGVLAAAVVSWGLGGAASAQECRVQVKSMPINLPVAIVPISVTRGAPPMMAIAEAMSAGETNQPVADTIKALEDKLPLVGWAQTPAAFTLKPGRYIFVVDRAAVKEGLDDLAKVKKPSDTEPPPEFQVELPAAVRQTVKDGKLVGVVIARRLGGTGDIVAVLGVEGDKTKFARLYRAIEIPEGLKTLEVAMEVPPQVFELPEDAVKPNEGFQKGSGEKVTKPENVPPTPNPIGGTTKPAEK
jgi:hypothetical protein